MSFKSELAKLENLLSGLDAQAGGAKKRAATKKTATKKRVVKKTVTKKRAAPKKSASKKTKVVRRKHRGGKSKGDEKFRTFKIVSVDGHDERKHQGRYRVRTHDEKGKELAYSLEQVARKAFTKWCERHGRKNNAGCKATLGLKETTQGSHHKVYTYKVYRKPGSGKTRVAKFPGRAKPVTFKSFKVVVESQGSTNDKNVKGGWSFYSR